MVLLQDDSQFIFLFRKFVSKNINETFYISDSLHKNYKSKVTLPPCLQCSKIVDKLYTTTHIILGTVYPLPLKQVFKEFIQLALPQEN